MRRAAALAIAATPAVPVLLCGFSKHYWGMIFLLWGIGFAVASGASLARILVRAGSNAGALSTRQIFVRQAVVWGLSFIALAVIDLTPLCLGQENGDGRNDAEMCLFLTVLWWTLMSVFVLPWVYVASAGVRRIMQGEPQPIR